MEKTIIPKNLILRKSARIEIFSFQVNVPDGTYLVLSVHQPLSGENRKESQIQDLNRVKHQVIQHQSVINIIKSQAEIILIIVK